MFINPYKMVLVPFTRKIRLEDLTPPFIIRIIVTFARDVKYLETNLDRNAMTRDWELRKLTLQPEGLKEISPKRLIDFTNKLDLPEQF